MKTVGGKRGGNLWVEFDGVVVVVAGQKQKIDERRGYSPAKPESECPALNIDLASKRLAGNMAGTCGLSLTEWLQWWQAGSKRSTGGRDIPPSNQNPSGPHVVLVWY